MGDEMNAVAKKAVEFESLFDLEIKGYNLPKKYDRLQKVMDDCPRLLVFLRHNGCIFTREMTRDFWGEFKKENLEKELFFVFQGDQRLTKEFFSLRCPEAQAISDPELKLFRNFQIPKGSLYQMFGPKVWASSIRALMKGNFQGKTSGDPFLMPAVMVVYQNRILWQASIAHAGDRPSPRAVVERLMRIRYQFFRDKTI